MYKSDSADSNDDAHDKDHLLHGEAALKRYLRKSKKVSRIIESNNLNGKKSSHLLMYLDKINQSSLPPKMHGILPRKSVEVKEIDCHDTVINEMYTKPFSQAIGSAKYVDFLNLRNTNLNDERAIAILSKIDRSVVTHIDLSENPALTPTFYKFLCELIMEVGSNLQQLELEANNITNSTLEALVNALCEAGCIQMLNLS